MRKLKKSSEQMAIEVFETLEKKIINKRDMKEINDFLTEFLNSAMTNIYKVKHIDFRAFERENNINSEADYIDLALEKALLIYSLASGTDYEKNTSNWDRTYKIIKKIPLIEHILKYKMEKRGVEIFGDLGLEIIGFDNNGNLMTTEKENTTEEQKNKWEEVRKDLGDNVMTKEIIQKKGEEKYN